MFDFMEKKRNFFRQLPLNQIQYIIDMSVHEDVLYNTDSFYFTAISSIMFGNSDLVEMVVECIDAHDDGLGAYTDQNI